MLQEIYCRNSEEQGYNPIQYETNNALEALLTKIKMILYTRRGDVGGQFDLGMNLEDALFEFGLDERRISSDFYGMLMLFAPEAGKYKIDFSIKFMRGTVRDMAYIDIYIDGTKYLGILAR